jgi:hypothetical protein
MRAPFVEYIVWCHPVVVFFHVTVVEHVAKLSHVPDIQGIALFRCGSACVHDTWYTLNMVPFEHGTL